MNPNPNSIPNSNPNPQLPQSICSNCNSDTQLILHNIILTPKSPPTKLCTSCVLSHYQKSICAQCFEPYDVTSLTPPPLTTAVTTGNNRLLPCLRCSNWSHLGCPRANIPKAPYLCPPCTSSKSPYKYFDFAKRRKVNQENGEKKSSSLGIDKEASKQLLGAGKIASITMAKAVVTARGEAERKAKEAALARKRASEAIDHVLAVAVKVENVKRKELSTGTGLKVGNYVPVRMDKNGGNNVGNVEIRTGVNTGNGNGNGAIETVPVPVSVVMPNQLGKNSGIGGDGVGKDSVNAGKPQSK